jgi:hypothetical protein
LGEHMLCKHEVVGSIPSTSTRDAELSGGGAEQQRGGDGEPEPAALQAGGRRFNPVRLHQAARESGGGRPM